MLDKKDFSTIESLIQKNLKNALTEFFETLILPYFEKNEKDHEEMRKTLDSHDAELDRIFRKLEKNEDDHEEIFHRLDRIEKHVTSHEKRIRSVETIVSS